MKALNGRTNKLTLTPMGSSTEGSEIVLNLTEDVPLRPAMNEPSTEVQAFQEGDYVSVTADGGYQNDTATAEFKIEDYEAIDEARANGNLWLVKRTGDVSDNGIAAMVSVSTGPTLTVNRVAVPTMTVTIAYVGTQQNPHGDTAE